MFRHDRNNQNIVYIRLFGRELTFLYKKYVGKRLCFDYWRYCGSARLGRI